MLKWLGIKLLQEKVSFKHRRKAATQFAKWRARLVTAHHNAVVSMDFSN